MILWLSAFGMLLSLYALHVRWKITKIPEYKPFCDFKHNVSCSKAFVGKYGAVGLLPNPLYGIFFYALVFIAANYPWPLAVLSSFGLLLSMYLGYLSYFKMKNFCLLCTAIYIINVLLMLSTLAMFDLW